MKAPVKLFSVAMAGIFLLVFNCAACAHKPAAKAPAQLTIAFQKFVGYGLIYLARDKGFLEDEGVELLFVDEQLDSARRDAFRQGMLDCELGTIDLLISKRAEGVPVVSVMAIDQSAGADGIAVAGDIHSVKELKGKRVAFARDDVGETFLSYVLENDGLSLEDVVVVPSAPNEVSKAFLDGSCDAAATWEPELSRSLKRPGSRLLVSSRETPGVIMDCLNVRKDTVINNPESVKALMRAWFRALEYYRSHPDEASALIAGYYGMSPEEYRSAVGGLEWIGYDRQDDPDEILPQLAAFDNIVAMKMKNRRIASRPLSSESIDSTLRKGLYSR